MSSLSPCLTSTDSRPIQWTRRLLSLVLGLLILGFGNAAMALQRGDRGNNVTELQTRLQQLGYNTGGIDGVFGDMTEAAVQKFQRSVQLPSDGKFGQQELVALGSMPLINTVPTRPSDTAISLGTLTPGTENFDVTRLQQRLKDFGYFQGETTAYYGSKTQRSVSSFQRDRSLSVTGIADGQTLQALGLRSGSVNSFPPPPSGTPSSSQGFTSGSTRQFSGQPVMPNPRYLVVIPKQNSETLDQVRQLIGNAQTYSSSKGDYISAGSFLKRSDAEKRSQSLRAYGLDARVEYQ